jgi:hypothetical protein
MSIYGKVPSNQGYVWCGDHGRASRYSKLDSRGHPILSYVPLDIYALLCPLQTGVDTTFKRRAAAEPRRVHYV